MKTIKIKLEKLRKENIDYSKLDNAIMSVNKLIHTNYLFMRSFLIYSFEKNYENITINEQFIRLGFRVIINGEESIRTKGRPIKNEIEDTLKKMIEFWKIFSSRVKLHTVKCDNISFILNNAATEIYTNIINNLLLNFDKYIAKCIKSHYCLNYEKPAKIFKPIIRDITKFIIGKKINKQLMKKKNTSHNKRVLDFMNYFSGKFLPINFSKTNSEKEIKTNTYKYLKSAYLMNKFIENMINKTYQFFPIKTSAYNKHITINTSALIEIFIEKDKANALKMVGNDNFKKIVWNKYFKIYDNNGNPLYSRKGYSFNNEIQTNGFTVSLSNINNNDIDGQLKKKRLMAEGRKKSYDMKNKLNDEEYNVYKVNKEENKIDYDIKIKEQEKKKRLLYRAKYKQLSETEKQKILYNIQLKKDFPDIECLIKNNDKFSDELRKKYNTGKVIICDPGKNNLLYCINPNGVPNLGKKAKYTDNFGISYDDNNKYMNYTNKTRLKFIKHHEYRKYIDNWKSNPIEGTNFTLKKFEANLSEYNSKSYNLDIFLLYCQEKVKSLNFFRKYYSDNFINKLAWFTYLNKWRHTNDLIRVIRNEFGDDVSFIIGDWNAKGRVKFMSTPNNYLKRKLKEYFNVYEINEHNTSKIHNVHYVKCKKLRHKYPNDDGSIVTKKIHSVLTFKKVVDSIKNANPSKDSINTNSNKNIKKIFSGNIGRDLNAVLNMRNILISLLKNKTRPPIFCRSTTI